MKARIVLFALALSALARQACAEQLVVLDFDTFTDAVSDDGKDYVYSPPERAAIVATLNAKFVGLPVTFTDVEPATGLFSKVYLNVGLADAGDVDFQNTKKIDDASIHIPKLMEIAGLTAPYAPLDIGYATVNIAAHETLHLLGTRHHDSFLPLGGGVPTPFIGSGFDPAFPGPAAATLTGKEFNSLTASVGFSAAKLLDPTLFVGPRSAVKLLLDSLDVDVDSADANDILDPQPLPFTTLSLPNLMPMPPGSPEVLFFADVAVVEEATITELDPPFGPAPEGDYYRIFAEEGDLLQVEVLSEILDYRFSDTFDTKVAVLDPSTGYSPVPWYASTAINDDERESTDSFILDLIVPATGSYVIEVFSSGKSGADVFGEYEMLVYKIRTVVVPEPDGAALLVFGAGALLGWRKLWRTRRGHHPNSWPNSLAS